MGYEGWVLEGWVVGLDDCYWIVSVSTLVPGFLDCHKNYVQVGGDESSESKVCKSLGNPSKRFQNQQALNI